MIDAILLIQDVQLLCFTVIFGFVYLQHRGDATRRWLFYSFLANAVGAVLDLSSAHLPAWLGREGLSLAMIPLSYALINIAVVAFLRRYKFTYWLSAAILLGTLPFFLLWSGHPYAEAWRSNALQDFAIALQSVVTGAILLGSTERSTRPPRLLLSGFYWLFCLVEFARFFVAFLLNRNPDSYAWLELTSSVAYVVATSVLPLAFIWMINSRLESDLLAQNMLDPLTQVQNRRGLRHALDREVARHLRTDSPFTVTILDLDRFKKLNDTYGHAIGDAVLVSIAALLRKSLRETDTVARLGGERVRAAACRTRPCWRPSRCWSACASTLKATRSPPTPAPFASRQVSASRARASTNSPAPANCSAKPTSHLLPRQRRRPQPCQLLHPGRRPRSAAH